MRLLRPGVRSNFDIVMLKLKLQVLLIPIFFADIPTDGIDHQHTKRFLHLVEPSHDLRQVEQEIGIRYRKLYPDEVELTIEKIQDNSLCDLDPDYTVEDVFQSGDLIRVITTNTFTRYIFDSGHYNHTAPFDMAQSTPLLTPAPALINHANTTSSKRTTDYFATYDNHIPHKANQSMGIPKTPSLNMKKIRKDQTPKFAPVQDDSNISLPPPEDTVDKTIPQKLISNTSHELPSTQKRITSGMLALPQHTMMENDTITYRASTKPNYNNSILNSSSSDEALHEHSYDKSISKIPRNMLPNQSQMISSSSPRKHKTSSDSPMSTPVSSESELGSDSDIKDDDEFTREAAVYKDPLNQLNSISKGEVIDIFKHRIVKTNKKIHNGKPESKDVAKFILGNLSIDMVDAPKASEYRGTRSSRKAPEDTSKPAPVSTGARRGRPPNSVNAKKKAAAKMAEQPKGEKVSGRQRPGRPPNSSKLTQPNSRSKENSESKLNEPIGKLQVVFEQMKSFESKLDSLMVPGEVFPKKVTIECLAQADIDQMYGDDELIINPKVHLHSSLQYEPTTSKTNPDISHMQPTIALSQNKTGLESTRLEQQNNVSTLSQDNNNEPDTLISNSVLHDSTELKTEKPQPNGKPTPAFDITGSLKNGSSKLSADSVEPKAIRNKSDEEKRKSKIVSSDIVSSSDVHNSKSSSTNKSAMSPPTPRNTNSNTTINHRTMTQHTPITQSKTPQSNSVVNRKTAKPEKSEHDKLKERAEKLRLQKLQQSMKSKPIPTPMKRKFDDSSSDDDDDDSSSDDDDHIIESKKPRLVTSAPTLKSQSPVSLSQTPFASSNTNQSVDSSRTTEMSKPIHALNGLATPASHKQGHTKANSHINTDVNLLAMKTPVSRMPNKNLPSGNSSVRRLTSLVDLAQRGVPEVKEPTKSMPRPKPKPKSIIGNDSDDSSSESSSSSSSDDSDDGNYEDNDGKFLSLKKVAEKEKPKKKSNLFGR